MRYLSVCSGIEAASVAWGPLGKRNSMAFVDATNSSEINDLRLFAAKNAGMLSTPPDAPVPPFAVRGVLARKR